MSPQPPPTTSYMMNMYMDMCMNMCMNMYMYMLNMHAKSESCSYYSTLHYANKVSPFRVEGGRPLPRLKGRGLHLPEPDQSRRYSSPLLRERHCCRANPQDVQGQPPRRDSAHIREGGLRNPIRIVFELSKDFYWILPQSSLSIGNILVNA